MPLLHYLCRHVHYSVPLHALFCAATLGGALFFLWRLHPLSFGPLTPAGSIFPIYPP